MSQTPTPPGSALHISERRMIYSCSNRKHPHSEKHFKFLSSYSKLSLYQREVKGKKLVNFIEYCSFNGKLCSVEDLKTTSSLRYGNCSTFNYNGTMDTDNLTTSHLLNKGLELVLNLDLYSYIKKTEKIGAVVAIHDWKDVGNPEEDGIDISPGFETSIALKQSQIK